MKTVSYWFITLFLGVNTMLPKKSAAKLLLFFLIHKFSRLFFKKSCFSSFASKKRAHTAMSTLFRKKTSPDSDERPERAVRTQPRAAPWVYPGSCLFRALKGQILEQREPTNLFVWPSRDKIRLSQKHSKLILLPLQGENYFSRLYPGRCPGLGSVGLSGR